MLYNYSFFIDYMFVNHNSLSTLQKKKKIATEWFQTVATETLFKIFLGRVLLKKKLMGMTCVKEAKVISKTHFEQIAWNVNAFFEWYE